MTLNELETILRERKAELPAQSYSASLFRDPELITRKLTEETFEVCLELGRPTRSKERIAEEAADVLYHLVVSLVEADVPLDEVWRVLEARRR